MVRSEETPLITTRLRRDLRQIVNGAIEGASGSRLVRDAVCAADGLVARVVKTRAVTLVSAGKAAVPMAEGFLSSWANDIRGGVVASPVGAGSDKRLDFFAVGHPVPTASSVDAGSRVLEQARSLDADDVLLVLLSGGASTSIAVPAPGLTLEAKVQATNALLRGGVPIDGINCVRKHLSGIKGGRLVAASPATVVTLAISDVVGPVPDDPAVIGSGPTVGDPTTFADAMAVIDRPSVRAAFPAAARQVLERGCRGEIPETPKPGSPGLSRSAFEVIGSRTHALRAAAQVAAELGYTVATIDTPVVGEARDAAKTHHQEVLRLATNLSRPACVLSAGETTVEVSGSGRGGRNQEFGLAVVEALANAPWHMVMASVGTDGIDGPTDAAGAVVDATTLKRGQQRGLGTPSAYLDNNDSHTYFDALGDLILTGPTNTNIGDIQVALLG